MTNMNLNIRVFTAWGDTEYRCWDKSLPSAHLSKARGEHKIKFSCEKLSTDGNEFAVNSTANQIEVPANLIEGASTAIKCWRYTLKRISFSL
jgi:hypothetical protein